MEFKRKLTAILSADVAGYSRLMADNEEETVRTLKLYRNVIENLITKFTGRLVDSPGDNILAEFSSGVDALRCAWDIQKEITSRNLDLPENRRMTFRIGINIGDVIEEEGRIYGDGVNVAARLESLAEAGGISISGNVYNHVKKKVSFRFEDQGEQSVKNIDEPIQAYRVVMESETDSRESVKQKTTSNWKRNLAVALVAFILLLGGAAVYVWDTYFRIPDVESPTGQFDEFKLPEGPSIAVLPFDNMSGDPEQESFSDGLTSEIIRTLYNVPDLMVISSTSSFSYKNKKVKVQEIGKELGVRYVVEGSVLRSGNRIRITAKLIDALTGNHLWAERYDRDLEDIFAIQDEVTTHILQELTIKLTHSVKSKSDIKLPDNLQAYIKFLQGTGYLSNFTKENRSQARKLVLEAIKLDPNWALSNAFLGMLNIVELWYGWCADPKHCIQEAMEYSEKAISLDANTPAPYSVIANVYIMKKQYEKAITLAEKAISVQPKFVLGYSTLGSAFISSGNPQMAIEALKKAIRLSPKFPMANYNLGRAHFGLGEYKKSIELFKIALNGMKEFVQIHVYLTASYIMAGMEDKARIQAEEILRIKPDFSIDPFADRLPYKNQSDTDRILNALRKAGLK